MKVVVIKYNAGNLHSVRLALQRLGLDPKVSDSPDEIFAADKVIFPGVGEASSAMEYLKQKSLDKVIPALKQPVLGICLGLQLLCDHSQENDTKCFGLFPAKVKKFPPREKVPHMGWNTIETLKVSFLPVSMIKVMFILSIVIMLKSFSIQWPKRIILFLSVLHYRKIIFLQFSFIRKKAEQLAKKY